MSSGFNTLCEPVLASLARGFLRLNTAINLGTQRSLSSLSIPTQREVTKNRHSTILKTEIGCYTLIPHRHLVKSLVHPVDIYTPRPCKPVVVSSVTKSAR